MFKLQIVLVPASANRSLNLGLPSVSSESSQLILPQHSQFQQQTAQGPQFVNGFSAPNGIGSLDPNVSTNTALVPSFLTSHISRPKLKKFLIFTKPTNSLYQLSQEILEKCNKIYPNLSGQLEIDTLQDADECDLDPDFVVKDVFNVFNVVRVILRNDVELDSDSEKQESLYSFKRRKLNNGLTNLQGSSSAGMSSEQPVNVAKRRSHVLKNSALRISTPLAHQIYPPPSQRNNKQVNSDYEDDNYGEDEAGDKSILPPPTVPQSPPIRISSGIGQKRMNIKGSEDGVSKSETVDPSKAKQQRLPSGTPSKPLNVIETPNKVGQLPMPQQAQSLLRISSTPVVTNKRITSGMLRIPEPKISEMERTMHEGLSSPAAGLLPPKSAKIPMKKPYISEADDSSNSDDDSDANKNVSAPTKEPLMLSSHGRASSSIADDNGSPTKKSPMDVTKNINVRVAELPPQRKSSLEAKVQKLAKNASELVSENRISNNTTRKDRFSESESEDDASATEANDTVRIHQGDHAEGSFHKSDLLEILKGSKFEIPPAFKRAGTAVQDGDVSRRPKKPYLTVLHKDIDNSEPDPRNILPSKSPRHAAQKAAQFISTGTSRHPLQNSSSSSSESNDDESDSESNIETDRSDHGMDELNLKKLNVHPLKSVVVAPDVATKHDGVSPIINSGQSGPAGSSEEPASTNIALEKPSTKPTMENEVDDVAGEKVPTEPKRKSADKLDETKPSTPAPSQELHERIDRQLSPSPSRNKKDFISPEFIEDSDEPDEGDATRSYSQSSLQDKENADPNNSGQLHTKGGKERKLASSASKRKQEAERRRLEREAIKKAKQEELERKRAEREAAKKAKQEEIARKKAEREAAKKAKQEELARRKSELLAKKKQRESKSTSENLGSQQLVKTPSKSEATTQEQNVTRTAEKDLNVANSSTTSDSPSRASKLDELRNKFASGKASITGPPKKPVNKDIVQLQASHGSSSESSSASESDTDSDSDSSSSSTGNETSLTKKSRRGIVDTPKGIVGSISRKSSDLRASELKKAPQSSQQPTATTPVKVPVTRIMDLVSPAGENNQEKSNLVSPPSKTTKGTRQALARNSLSSLSDLVSRGVPEVRENQSAKPTPQAESSSSSEEDEISSESNDDSDSEESDSSDNGSGSNFINAKNASKVLGKKKTDSGFSSLLKDSKKK